MKEQKKTVEPEKTVTTATSETKPVPITSGHLTATENPPTMVGLVPTDIIIPKVLLMQGMSDFVMTRKAQLGDIVRSTNVEKLGDPEHPFAFIPLSQPESQWVIEVKPPGSDKFKYVRQMKRDSTNSGLDWTFHADKDGNEVPAGTPNSLPGKRVQRLSFFALLPGDVAADQAERAKADRGELPDFSKALTPVLIGMRSFSFPAGKEVVTFFSQAASFKQPAWKYTLQVGCKVKTNEKGTFWHFTVDRSKPQPVAKELLPQVEYWAQIVKNAAGKLQVDESQDEEAGGLGGQGGTAQF